MSRHSQEFDQIYDALSDDQLSPSQQQRLLHLLTMPAVRQQLRCRMVLDGAMIEALAGPPSMAMPRWRRRIFGGALILAVISTLIMIWTNAAAGHWRVATLNGEVRLNGRKLEQSAIESSPFRLETGPVGTAEISRGEERFRCYPNTMINLRSRTASSWRLTQGWLRRYAAPGPCYIHSDSVQARFEGAFDWAVHSSGHLLFSHHAPAYITIDGNPLTLPPMTHLWWDRERDPVLIPDMNLGNGFTAVEDWHDGFFPHVDHHYITEKQWILESPQWRPGPLIWDYDGAQVQALCPTVNGTIVGRSWQLAAGSQLAVDFPVLPRGIEVYLEIEPVSGKDIESYSFNFETFNFSDTVPRGLTSLHKPERHYRYRPQSEVRRMTMAAVLVGFEHGLPLWEQRSTMDGQIVTRYLVRGLMNGLRFHVHDNSGNLQINRLQLRCLVPSQVRGSAP